MTYAELIAAIAGWSHRTDLTALVPSLLSFANGRINRELRVREMIGRGTLSVTASLTALPADFLAVKSATVGTVRMSYITEDQMLLVASDQGSPEFFTLVGNQVQVSPVPSAATNVVLTYFKKLPTPSETQSNWLLEDYPDVYLYAVLSELGQYLFDDGLTARAEARYAAAKKGLERAGVVAAGDRLTPSFDQIV